MNRILKWLEQHPKRMIYQNWSSLLGNHFLLIALPTLYLVLSGVGIWYFKEIARYSKKKFNDRAFHQF